MKLYLTTAIALGLAAPAFACETLPIQNSNATQRADADCPLPEAQGGKSMLGVVFFALTDDDEAPVDPPEEPTTPEEPPAEEEPTEPEAPEVPADEADH